MDPASKIVRRLGGASAVAAATGTAYTAPYRWQAPREKGGSGGLIPQRHHVRLLAYARARGIPLSAEDFLAAAEAPAGGAPAAESASPTDPLRRAAPNPRFETPPEAGPARPADLERAAMPPPPSAPSSRS